MAVQLSDLSIDDLVAIVESDDPSITDEQRIEAGKVIEAKTPGRGRPKKVVDGLSQSEEEELFYSIYGLCNHTREQLSELKKLKFKGNAWEKLAAEYRAVNQKRVDDITAAQKQVEAECKAQSITFDVDAWNVALKQVNGVDNELQARKPATFEDYVQAARKLYPYRFITHHSSTEPSQIEPRPALIETVTPAFSFPAVLVTPSAPPPASLDPESDAGYLENLRTMGKIADSLVE